MKNKVGYVIILSLTLVGCGDPYLKALRSDSKESSRRPFWAHECRYGTVRWQQAEDYCLSHPNKPNCSDIVEIAVLEAGSTDIPRYGDVDLEMKVPSFDE